MEFEIVKESEPSKENDQNIALVEDPKWTLEEIALSKSTLEQIDEMIAYIQNKDKLLSEWQFERFLKTGSALSVNFFGVPGTGKSITSEAIAHKLGMSIIRVNYGEVESSLVGGTSENLVSIFQKAEKSNSLLFFDEADSVLSRRIENLSQAADHGVNSAKSTLLTLLDKFDGIIVFATNLFDNYDEAFVRRILFNVEFLPPDLEMRQQLWRFHLSEKVPREVSYDRLAILSEGLCGGDIRNITIKLGLRLLTGKIETINESLVNEEINLYVQVKKRQHREIKLVESSTNTSENIHANFEE
ncbi:MAG: ATP-binding protein [Microcystis sp. M53598_WE2]|jgi:SpoVK/Ycf46/Vps4 family AAA+-type ATPase|uniref:ATP-dependent zinc metalloprotease FtsH 2 n=1 Tax=Microcystis aeruginosa NIES-2521 TaxID=2303983 RepID=A0A5A5S4E0_MICAE|nr:MULTISPECIES: ATP-binding protein [Microcystis]MDJ0669691.1 ATP-binding protein [Microcystis sp. M53598_WE2]GCA80322.1 ATP-dependent zinc metalloprotease FtsH 2 [Microcystis aeruginosa NIES-2521]